MCREIMAPQVEYGEETLAPTEADETQQQPEKSRCVHVCLHSLERGICSLCEFVFCARARMDAALVFLCVHLPAKDLTFFCVSRQASWSQCQHFTSRWHVLENKTKRAKYLQ